jgi:hypothetical protein
MSARRTISGNEAPRAADEEIRKGQVMQLKSKQVSRATRASAFQRLWLDGLGIVASCALLCGCASLTAVSSGQIGCAQSDISITNDEIGFGTRTWTAECHGRTYFCSAHGGSQYAASQVTCKESTDSTDAPARTAPPPTREDEAIMLCNVVHKHGAEFTPYWVAHSDGGKALDPLPDSRDFVPVCATLPVNIQRCMFEQFRVTHEKSCDAMLSRIDVSTRDKIDSLFLEARGPNASK